MRTARRYGSERKVQFALTSGPGVKFFDAVSRIIGSAKRQVAVSVGFIALAIAAAPAAAATPSFSACAWPLEATPVGFGNYLLPETFERFFTMSIDPQTTEMTIKGTYPNARFMSFVVYNGEVPTSVAGHLFDAKISPDPGSVNPFVRPRQRGNRNYTIQITRSQIPGSNVITALPGFAWVAYRVYLPNAGENTTGGVSLPSVTVTDQAGTHTIEPCTHVNLLSDVTSLLNVILPPQFDTIGTSQTPPTDRIWIAPPDVPPPRLFPNPDNKYMVTQAPGPFQPGRIIVIRGKAPGFPDTYNGGRIWRPAPGFDNIQLRYWSLCQSDFASPFPVVQCTADLTTKLDQNGFYTVVITDDRIAPDWLPAGVTWLPWGDEQPSKFLFIRNMLPAPNFHRAIQDAIANGCTFKFDFPNYPTSDQMKEAGRCAKRVMGAYYPVAAWCNQSTFIVGGADACLKAQ